MTELLTSEAARLAETRELRAQLAEAQQTLEAIRSGGVDALVVSVNGKERIFTLKGADQAYQILIEAMQQGALIVNSGGMILYANRSAAGMLKAIRNYRYNLQAYWYRLVYELATGKRPLGFRFLFIEKEPPFACQVCEVGPELMSWAIADFEKAVTLYKECTASGVWPSYPEEIQVIDVKSTTTAAPINFA
jgi:exonuclease VII small subunit